MPTKKESYNTLLLNRRSSLLMKSNLFYLRIHEVKAKDFNLSHNDMLHDTWKIEPNHISCDILWLDDNLSLFQNISAIDT